MRRLITTLFGFGLLLLSATWLLHIAASRTGRAGPNTWGAARQQVADAWGGPVEVTPPRFLLGGWGEDELLPISIALAAQLDTVRERRGLLDFQAYELRSLDRFVLINDSGREGPLDVHLTQPPGASILYDYTLTVQQGAEQRTLRPSLGSPTRVADDLAVGEELTVTLSYATKGMDRWRYALSAWKTHVLPELTATVTVDTQDFRLGRRGLPHTRDVDGDRVTLAFALDDFATSQDLDLQLVVDENGLGRVAQVVGWAPGALAVLLGIVWLWSQVFGRPLTLVHAGVLTVLHTGFFVVTAYGTRFVEGPIAMAVALVLTIVLFAATMPHALGRRLALTVALPALVVLTAGFAAAMWVPQARGLTLIGLGLGTFVATSWPLTRSDPSRWPVLRKLEPTPALPPAK